MIENRPIKISSVDQHATEDITHHAGALYFTQLSTKNQRKHTRKANRKICIHFGKQRTDVLFPPADGMGDHIANALTAIGLTKKRYAKLKAQFLRRKEAGEEDCSGCNWRHRFANWATSFMGTPGKGPELQKIIELESVDNQMVCECEAHGICLPHLQTDKEYLPAIRGMGFYPCQNCEQYQPNNKGT